MLRRGLISAFTFSAFGTSAAAAPLTTLGVFMDAGPVPKLIMAGLLAATLAAAVICGMKLASGPKLSGGSAFLSGLRAGGPLAGLLGAGYATLMLFIGLANASTPPPIQVVAPGLAEAVLLISLGLLAGAVAAIGHALVEARIDRTVLRP